MNIGANPPNPNGPYSNTASPVTLLFGNTRTITTQRFGGTGSFGADVNTTNLGQFSFENASNTGSISTINYDFAAQGFALDFTGNDLLTLVGVDLDAGTADFYITSTDGTNSFTTAIQNVNAADPVQDLDFNIIGGAVNGAAITGITVTVDTVSPGIQGSDGFFNDIQIDDSTQIIFQIPEPASMALFGLIGLGGVIAARRKMRKNTA